MSATTNCATCRALVWTTDVPDKKTGNCWRCEVKRLQRRLAALEFKVCYSCMANSNVLKVILAGREIATQFIDQWTAQRLRELLEDKT